MEFTSAFKSSQEKDLLKENGAFIISTNWVTNGSIALQVSLKETGRKCRRK
jgi:hypothetical protein